MDDKTKIHLPPDDSLRIKEWKLLKPGESPNKIAQRHIRRRRERIRLTCDCLFHIAMGFSLLATFVLFGLLVSCGERLERRAREYEARRDLCGETALLPPGEDVLVGLEPEGDRLAGPEVEGHGMGLAPMPVAVPALDAPVGALQPDLADGDAAGMDVRDPHRHRRPAYRTAFDEWNDIKFRRSVHARVPEVDASGDGAEKGASGNAAPEEEVVEKVAKGFDVHALDGIKPEYYCGSKFLHYFISFFIILGAMFNLSILIVAPIVDRIC